MCRPGSYEHATGMKNTYVRLLVRNIRVFFVLSLLIVLSESATADRVLGDVKEIIRGDIIRISFDGDIQQLQLGYIKCPQRTEFLGEEAVAQTTALCLNKTLEIRLYNEVKADGLIGDVILDSEKTLSTVLLEQGLALLSTQQNTPADLTKAFRHAMLHENGLHARRILSPSEPQAVDTSSYGPLSGKPLDLMSAESNRHFVAEDGTARADTSMERFAPTASDAFPIAAPMQNASARYSSTNDKETGWMFIVNNAAPMLTAVLIPIALVIIIITVIKVYEKFNANTASASDSNIYSPAQHADGPHQKTSGANQIPVCARCGENLKWRESFIGEAIRRGRRVVVLGGDASDIEGIYEAVFCPSCQKAECVSCKGKNLQSPCSWCGESVLPGWPKYFN